MTELERLITQLVREAPAVDRAVAGELVDRLRGVGSPLALAIARVIELVALDSGAQRVDPGIALPALAMACATLVDPALGPREHEAARYEIETLLPVPDRSGRARDAIDVPVTALNRGPRPRT